MCVDKTTWQHQDCATLCKFQSEITIRNPQRARRSDYPFRLRRRAPVAMLKGRPYLLRLSEHTHAHPHPLSLFQTHTHTHPAAAKAKGKGRGTTKGKANSSQVKQLLFKLDGVDFGNNNNKKINKYMCVCTHIYICVTI